ncbi:MAG: single-stranded-DNA-specific exonuclease RecJ [Clostridia bacterium]|nr:single-stranded-DNA-specific exonuclease RecJ [Clostridia bacterium]
MNDKIHKPKTRRWTLRKGAPERPDGAAVSALSDGLRVSRAFASLLCSRGYTDVGKANAFLRAEEEILHDPFLLPDMDRAVDTVERALKEEKKIRIYGDYDVDGVTSVSTLFLYLKSRGADVSYYIPDRIRDGYGMSASAVEEMARDGVALVVTVDTGVTANEEIAAARARGLSVVVTDHHECRDELPEADAVVNPRRRDSRYPFDGLAGVGVVFKLICALEMKRTDDPLSAVRSVCSDYADLVSLGTIADVMPIVDENRLIVKYGLSRIRKGSREAISAIIAASRKRPDGGSSYQKPPRITSSFIGFTVAPRINAAGRIASAARAVELFLTDSPARAKELADELCEINRLRQAEENRIAAEALAKIEEGYDTEKEPVIVLEDDSWHHGVVGIVSSRITERFGLPSILISYEGTGVCTPDGEDVGKGSGRSVRGLNLVEALAACSDLLEKYGGHELAAGLTLKRKNVPAFRRRINEYAAGVFSAGAAEPSLEYDMELAPGEADLAFAEELQLIEPCGIGNPAPCFMMRDIPVLEVLPVSAGKHTKLILDCGGTQVSAMFFSRSPASVGVFSGERADLLFSVEINEYGGARSVQFFLKDLRRSETAARLRAKEKARFEELCSGAEVGEDEDAVPDRADIAAVYTLLRRETRVGNDEMSCRAMLALLAENAGGPGYLKLRFSLLILEELGLIRLEEREEETYRITLEPVTEKTVLERSALLRRLRASQKRENDHGNDR